MKKYEFTGEVKNHLGITLRRIKAMKNMKWATANEQGGWIETEENLEHAADAWVSGDAWFTGMLGFPGKTTSLVMKRSLKMIFLRF